MFRIKKVITREGSAIKKEFQERSMGYILTALGLVAGLAWNDFIKAVIDSIFPTEDSINGLWAKLIYAVIITLVIVIVSVYLLRIFQKDENQ